MYAYIHHGERIRRIYVRTYIHICTYVCIHTPWRKVIRPLAFHPCYKKMCSGNMYAHIHTYINLQIFLFPAHWMEYAYIHVYIRMHTYIHTYKAYAYMHAYIPMHTYIHTYKVYSYIHAYKAYAYIHAYIPMHTYIHTRRMHTCMHTFLCIHTCIHGVCIHTCIHGVCIHTCMHAYNTTQACAGMAYERMHVYVCICMHT